MKQTFHPIRNIANEAPYGPNDVMIVFGELFNRGYVNGIIEEAKSRNMKIIYSTVGRRNSDKSLRPLNEDELAQSPQPLINIPLEAGFDYELTPEGNTFAESLSDLSLKNWQEATIPEETVSYVYENASRRFKDNTAAFMVELKKHISPSSRVLFVHTMAGGILRAKIMMVLVKYVARCTDERFIPSKLFWESRLGRVCSKNMDMITAETFDHMVKASEVIRPLVKSCHYICYGYHGTEVLINNNYQWQSYTPYLPGWAKCRLEEYCNDYWQQGIPAAVFNCPEILTNSSAVFPGVELSLYQLLAAFKKEAPQSNETENLFSRCQKLLKPDFNIADLIEISNEYLTSALVQKFDDFENWPNHSEKQQLEFLLSYSEKAMAFNQSDKSTVTMALSEEVIKATGIIMLNESFKPSHPVLWIGHDVVAKLRTTNE